MTDFPEALERRLTIRARPETVFRFFTDTNRFAKWWGEGSRIEPRVGGQVVIQYPGGIIVNGEVVELDPPRRIVFTYKYASGVPTDGSLVTITLDSSAQGTTLQLRHAFSSAKIRDTHVQGWRYQLAVFSRAVAEDELPGVIAHVDEWLRAWGDPDAAARRTLLESCATSDVVFRDAFSATEGLEDLLAHLEAVQIFMPGVTLSRDGDVRLSHGTGMAGWAATGADGAPQGKGVNVYDLAPDGRLARVVGFWG